MVLKEEENEMGMYSQEQNGMFLMVCQFYILTYQSCYSWESYKIFETYFRNLLRPWQHLKADKLSSISHETDITLT